MLRPPFPFLGDSTAALQEAVDLKGRGALETPSQVLAVLRCRDNLTIPVAHLANEANTAADALSRLEAPEGNRKTFPPALAKAERASARPISHLWELVEPPASRR